MRYDISGLLLILLLIFIVFVGYKFSSGGLWMFREKKLYFYFPLNIFPLFVRLVKGREAETQWVIWFENKYQWKIFAYVGLIFGILFFGLGLVSLVLTIILVKPISIIR